MSDEPTIQFFKSFHQLTQALRDYPVRARFKLGRATILADVSADHILHCITSYAKEQGHEVQSEDDIFEYVPGIDRFKDLGITEVENWCLFDNEFVLINLAPWVVSTAQD